MIAEKQVKMSVPELVDVIAVAARWEYLKRHPHVATSLCLLEAQGWDAAIDAIMERRGDGLPTMAEEAESTLSEFSCVCGEPMTPGVVHRRDKPCYYLETPDAQV